MNRLRASSLPVAALLLALLAGCRGDAGEGDIEALPGGVTMEMDQSAFPEQFRKAALHMRNGQVTEAEAVYRQILAADPGNATAYIGAAGCRIYQEDLDGAERDYRRALELDPRSTPALTGLGAVAHYRGEYAGSLQFYERARALKPDQPTTYWGLATNYDRLGRMDEAREQYAKFLEMAPESQFAPAARARLAQLGADAP